MSDYSQKVMRRLRTLVEQRGMSVAEFGRRMGYKDGPARKSASQFLKTTTDPRLSMLKKAADALEMSVAELLALSLKDE